MISTDTKTGGNCPEFLKISMTNEIKDSLEIAYAKHLQTLGISPQRGMKKKPQMKTLLPYLQDQDDRWMDIRASEMVSTPPRDLIHRMNMHLGRWIKQVDEVQKVIDRNPIPEDPSEAPEKASNKGSDTDSEVDENGKEEQKSEPYQGVSHLLSENQQIQNLASNADSMNLAVSVTPGKQSEFTATKTF